MHHIVRTQCQGSRMLSFLPWLDASWRWTHQIEWCIFTLCAILKFAVSSAAKAEQGAFFLNWKEGNIIRLILKELGHPQPPIPVHCDKNKTAVGITINSINKQRSRSMEMQYFWVADQVDQGYYLNQWYSWQENLGDYQSKHHIGIHHFTVRPWYLYQANSPLILPRELAPAALRGCVGTLTRDTSEVPLCQRFPSTEQSHNNGGDGKSIYQGLLSAALELAWPTHDARRHVEATYHNEIFVWDYLAVSTKFLHRSSTHCELRTKHIAQPQLAMHPLKTITPLCQENILSTFILVPLSNSNTAHSTGAWVWAMMWW